MKSNNAKAENGMNNNVTGFLFKAYAAQNRGKHGSDEDMFASLKEDYEREKAEAAEKRRAGRGALRRKMLITLSAAGAALIVTCAVLIPFLLKDNTPNYEILDGLYVVPVTETQLSAELGFSPAIPRPEGYTIDAYNVYKTEGWEIKAYSFHYSTELDLETKNIDIFCVIKNDFTFMMEKIIEEEGIIKIFASKMSRLYIDDKDDSKCRIMIKSNKYIINLKTNDLDLLSWIIMGLDI